MNEAAKQARREYYREYRRKHPEKVREYNERYWTKKAAEVSPIGGETDEREKESA